MSLVTNIKRISNPLTIIAIFAGLAEINATVVLGIVPESLQGIFIWFIILFPSVLVIIFFITLNYNPKVLYAPSDFSNEDNFLKILASSKEFNAVQVEINRDNFQNSESLTDIVRKSEGKNFNREPFLPETREHLKLANDFFRHFQNLINSKFQNRILEELSFGIQAPEYFVMEYTIPKNILKDSNYNASENIIIRVTEDHRGQLNLIAIGKDIVEPDPQKFAYRLFMYVDKQIIRIVDFNKLS